MRKPEAAPSDDSPEFFEGTLADGLGEPSAASSIGDLLAAEFTLRHVLDYDDAASAVLALKERGFAIVAPDGLREEAIRQEAEGV